jgi:DNA-3-methyladenine glycosylase I
MVALGIGRCFGDDDPLYAEYHDHEWGNPVHGEAAILERIALEGFQSGLSWLIVLRKREAFREVFGNFDPEFVANLGPADVERLLGDARIIRNRAKIEATINNAKATLALRELREPPAGLPAQQTELWADGPVLLDKLFWSFAPNPPSENNGQIPSSTPESVAMSKTLKKLGFKFFGPTTAYAAMQACGLVNDHAAGCPSNA